MLLFVLMTECWGFRREVGRKLFKALLLNEYLLQGLNGLNMDLKAMKTNVVGRQE